MHRISAGSRRNGKGQGILAGMVVSYGEVVCDGLRTPKGSDIIEPKLSIESIIRLPSLLLKCSFYQADMVG